MEYRYVDTKESLKDLYLTKKITLWQFTLLYKYLMKNSDNESREKQAVKLIDNLFNHKVIDEDLCYALANQYETYITNHMIQVINTNPISVRIFNPFEVLPCSFFAFTGGNF